MGEKAVELQTSTVAVEGMEELFEGANVAPPTPSEVSPALIDETTQENFEPGPSNLDETHQGWSLKEAADHLGISINTVRKRLQQGTLDGFKVEGPYGFQWRISPPKELDAPPAKLEESTPPDFTATPSEIVGEEAKTIIRPYEESQSDRLLRVVEAQLELIGRLQNELAMKDRQLIEKDNEVKLLVDSKRKKTWWQRLVSLGAGGG